MATKFFKLLIPTLMMFAYCATAATESAPPPAAQPDEPGVHRDEDMAKEITKEFRSDPLFSSMNITIDLYKGLAIVHGGAPNQEMIGVITQKLEDRPGIDVVYNYMTSGEGTGVAARSIAVTYDYFDRMRDVGMHDNAFVVAGRVMTRLEADPQLAAAEIDVDSYLGLIILHGSVPAPELINRAREIARHTDGVEAVLSYVSAESPAYPVTDFRAPIVIRDVITEPVPVTVPVYIDECGKCR